MNENATSPIVMLLSLIAKPLSLFIHVATIIVAYKSSGMFAAIVSFCLPVLSEIYWFFAVGVKSGEDFGEGAVFLRDGFEGLLVVARNGENHALHKNDGRFRPARADDLEETFHALFDLWSFKIWQCVDYVNSSVDSGHQLGNLVVEFGVTGKTEVIDFAVEHTSEDGCVDHSGTIGASTLKHACAVHDDWLHS